MTLCSPLPAPYLPAITTVKMTNPTPTMLTMSSLKTDLV
jgi:hypothetical protein